MKTDFKLVSLLRDEFDKSPWYGYVVLSTDALIVIHRVSDSYNLDGYCAFRREDVTQVPENFCRADLINRALRLKSQTSLGPHGVVATSLADLMLSVEREYGVLVIYRERSAPGVCELGTLRVMAQQTYGLNGLDPDAYWSVDKRIFNFADVTYVEFGSEYETTLLQVARDRELH